MAQAEAGTVTVKVVPDVSGMEPAIRAELARIAGKLTAHQPFKGEVSPDALADAVSEIGGELAETAGDSARSQSGRMADKLLERFVIMERNA